MTQPRGEGLVALGRQGAVYALGNVLSRLGGLILLPLYLWVLTPNEYGALEMFYTTSAILGVFVSGGLAQAALRFYFEYREEAERRSVITTAMVAAATFSGATALALWAFAAPAAELLVGVPGYESSLRIVLLTLIVQMTSEVGLSFFRVRNYPWKFVLASLGQLVLQVAINIVTVAKLGWGVPGVLIGNLLGAAAAGIVVVYITVAECGWKFSAAKLVDMLRYTMPMIIAGVAAIFLDRADRFILQTTLGLEAVGVYALAEKLAMILSVGFLQPFMMAYGAYRFSIIDHPDRASLQQRVLRFYLAAACFLGLLIVVSAPALLKLISQEAYWIAAGLLPVLVFRNILGGAQYVFQTGILYAKKTRHSMVIQVSSGLLRVAAALALVGGVGLIAPAYAALIGISVAAIASLLVSRRYDPVDWDLYAVAKVMLFTVGCFLLAGISDGGLFASCAIVLVFLALCALGKVVSGEEIRAAFRSVSDWRRRRRGGGAGGP